MIQNESDFWLSLPLASTLAKIFPSTYKLQLLPHIIWTQWCKITTVRQTNAWISANLTALRSLSSDSVGERVS